MCLWKNMPRQKYKLTCVMEANELQWSGGSLSDVSCSTFNVDQRGVQSSCRCGREGGPDVHAEIAEISTVVENCFRSTNYLAAERLQEV